MALKYWTGGHTKHRLMYHLVWIPKYRRRVLRGKVAVRPEAVAPEELLQLGKLLAHQVARPSLEALDHLGHRIGGLDLDQHMNVVRQHLDLLDPPPVDLARFVQEMPHADGYFAETVGAQSFSAVKRYIQGNADIMPQPKGGPGL